MHQRGWLQSQAERLPRHFAGREFAQFFIDQGQQAIRSFSAALANRVQDLGHFAHFGPFVGPGADSSNAVASRNNT